MTERDRTLSHLDDDGRARMVDVSGKADTVRVAVAAGELRTTPEVILLVRADGMPKADVLATARIAAIAGAKRTSELIPLCHPLALSSVNVSFGFTDTSVTIEATAKTTGPTGVEMEALTAVSIAGLTLHDMVKAVDPAASVESVRLLSKDGGKRGRWQRDVASAGDAPLVPGPRSAVVVVASTGGALGTREDTTGPRIAEWLSHKQFEVRGPLVVADADIASGIDDALRGGPTLVVTTGGTGVSPTDATPEATRRVLDQDLPGLAEAIRQKGSAVTPHASLSRGLVGLSGRTVVVNLPGSPGGVEDGLSVLDPVIDHLLAQVAGRGSPPMREVLAVITSEPLDPATVDHAVSGPEHGAVVTMSGVVRNHDQDQSVAALEYRAHPDAERFLRTCCESVSTEFGLPVAAMHRVGALVVGDIALVASVAAPHRGEAFAACTALVDRIKVEVPIWKRQQFAEGRSEWVGL